MKKIKLFIFLALIFVGGFSVAQSSKIAHINVQTLLGDMPEMKTVKADLKKLESSYTTDLQSSMKELQTKAQTYETEAQSLTQSELEQRAEEFRKKAQELQTMEQNIQQARQAASQELQKKQQEMLTPLIEKSQLAIQKVARAKGFQYVLDSSPGGGVILAEGTDILLDVRKELGF